jgi:ankyrin repeat protein
MAIAHTMEEEDGNGHGGEDLDLEVVVPEDVQAVMNAAEEGDAEALTIALENLKDGVDCEGEDGDRPLHIACLYGHLSCVQILLTAGANIEVRDEDGALPLHDACAGGYKDIVSMLIRAANSPEQLKRVLDSFDIDGDTPLHHAARGNHSDVVQMLLDSGANPKIINLIGQRPADLADPSSPSQILLNDAVKKLNDGTSEA